MVIHDRSYTRWEGDKDARVMGVWVILTRGVRTGIAQLFKRKLMAQLLSFWAYGPFLFALGVMYMAFFLTANVDQFPDMARNLQQSGIVEAVTPYPDTVWKYLFRFQLQITLVLCVLVGSGLIAEDRRTNALELYFSRPVSVRQYVLGKLSVIGFFLALVTLVPACLLIVLQMFFSGFELSEMARLNELLWRTLAAGSLFILFLSLLILAASSLAQRARTAAILWIGFLVIVDLLIAGIVGEVFSNENLRLLSLHFNMGQCMAWLLGSQSELDTSVPVGGSAIALAGWSVLCLAVILRRVRPVEVVA